MLFSFVFAQHRLRQNRPHLFRIAEDSPLLSGLQHLTSCLSASYALFSLTAIFQPFSFQSLPHSFHRDGGCTPLSPFVCCFISIFTLSLLESDSLPTPTN